MKFVNHYYKLLSYKLNFYYSKETLTQVFSCEICEIFKNIYFEEHLRTSASELLVEHFLTFEEKLLFMTEVPGHT